ncbi:hypothetical protein PRK78_006285 [Emydomyces testavorans]|uniref:Uncharacterized protein n=1 Tax=Emydomyces testavorans TaxID=2070801 RepID=A0AAF0DLH7_9EURO|nr:hypothetical protein PRK78_006285 [Emydomyces testavorans]
MSNTEESPAQQAARLRRERREAKIRAGGSARLDKITSLSGRTPASMREELPSSISPVDNSNPESQTHQPSRSASPLPNTTGQSADSVEAQEAYLRALLRSKQPLDQPQEADPTAKLLSTLMGFDSASSDATGASGAAAPPAADILSENLTTLGLPSSVANFFTQQLQPESADVQRKNRIWKALHTVLSFVMGIWLIIALRASMLTYGVHPPPPATAMSPFVHFITAEMILGGARLLTNAGDGQLRTARPWMQLLSNIIRDGRIILFLLGIASLWMRMSDAIGTKS